MLYIKDRQFLGLLEDKIWIDHFSGVNVVPFFSLKSLDNLSRVFIWSYLALGVVCACDAFSLSGAYVQMQGGVGGIDTTRHTENSDPYDVVSLTDGMAYRFLAGHISSLQSFDYGF